jgi:6-phosphogluconolactonase (cycloisomerase 2 family)
VGSPHHLPPRWVCGWLFLLLAGCGTSDPPTTFVYAGGGKTIAAFRADLSTGALALQGTVSAGDDAFLLEVDPRRHRAYVQTQLGIPVVIRAYELDGSMAPAGDFVLPHPLVEGVTQLGVHPTAPWLLISATGQASGLQDQLIPLDGGGRLGAAKVISTDYYAFGWDPGGGYFFGLDGVSIGQFVFDAPAGSLRPNDPPQAQGSEGHPFLSLGWHPGGRWVYTVEEGAIGLFDYDPARGQLALREYASSPLPAEPSAWTGLAVHPGGRSLYALGYLRGSMFAFIDQFALDRSGSPRFVRRETGGPGHTLELDSLQAPLVLGDYLIAGGRSAATGKPVLVVYRIDPATGTLTAVGAPTELGPPDSIAVNFIAAFRP